MSMGQLLQLGPSGPKPLISGYSSYLRYQIFNYYWDEGTPVVWPAGRGGGPRYIKWGRRSGKWGREEGAKREKEGEGEGERKGKGINRDDTNVCPTPGLTVLARRLRYTLHPLPLVPLTLWIS